MTTVSRAALAALLTLGVLACGGSDDVGRPGGSCTRPDPTAASLTMCHELENKTLAFEAECEATGGTWSAAACDPAMHARRCRQTTSVNGVERADLYFFKAGSEMGCLGDETQL
jgi:hypothetical protein